MPWNFPFWLPFKACIPPIVIGNSIMMKHSPSTPLCSLAIEEAFKEAGFGKGEYQNIFVNEGQCRQILVDRRVRSVKFTGSTEAGSKVAMLAAQACKKGCFELGGDDPFVVLKDADMQRAVDAAYASRMGNSGQACINAKRFIITSPVYDEFKERLLEKIKSTTVIGDPLDPKTNLGPLALSRQKTKLYEQINKAITVGDGHLLYGDMNYMIPEKSLEQGNYVTPFVIEDINPNSSIYGEEFFGPVFNLYRVDSSKEAIDLANRSDYGLASTVFTEDLEKAEYAAMRLRTGTVFVNDCVTSGSEYPGGGIKGSGFGRECYKDGLLDIANRKTIIRRKQQ